MPKPDRTLRSGRAEIRRRNDRYTVELGRLKLENLTRDEVAELSAALMAIINLEHEEMIEEKRARGEKIYVEYRGEQVAQEY
jgi:hypothetical protein